MQDVPLLPILLLIPAVGALAVMLVPTNSRNALRIIAIAVAMAALAFSVYIAFGMSADTNVLHNGFSHFYSKPLFSVGDSDLKFALGVDWLGMLMVLLTGLLFVVALVVSLNIQERVREYFSMFLLLEVGCLGVFTAADLFLFYVFWELILIPMFVIIAVWGGKNRQYASLKFILFTLGGSLFMLFGIIGYYAAGGSGDLTNPSNIASDSQDILFFLVFIGLAVKIPLFPFHTWLPDAHTEAPTAGSIVLAGILLKLGTYGFLRVLFPLFPSSSQHYSSFLAILGVVNILYGAFLAMSQKDIKRIIASSSISHMGFVVLALATLSPLGFSGATMQMIGHGIITGGLFLLIGVIYDRTHVRGIGDFGGLFRVTPFYYGIFLLVALAAIGLPGLNGFVGEFTCLYSGYDAFYVSMPWLPILATFGVLLGVIYMLNLVAKMFSGPVNQKWIGISDLDSRESLAIMPLCFAIVFLGVAPAPIFNLMSGAMKNIADMIAR